MIFATSVDQNLQVSDDKFAEKVATSIQVSHFMTVWFLLMGLINPFKQERGGATQQAIFLRVALLLWYL